jgi:hypothetical protein
MLEERIAKLEEMAATFKQHIIDIWKTVSDLRELEDDKHEKLEDKLVAKCSEVCSKITMCQNARDQWRKNLKEEVDKSVENELKALRVTIDRVWSIFWKTMCGLLTVIITMCGWNIALMQRVSATDTSIARIEEKQRNYTDDYRATQIELIALLKEIRQDIREKKGEN